MAQSVLDICNMALDYCNTRNITSIDESTKEVLIDGYKDYCSWQYFNKTTQEIEENHIRRCFDDGYSSAYPLYPDDATCSTLSYDYSNNFEDKGILFGGY